MWKHIIAIRDSVTGVSYRARVLLYAIASRCNEGGWCRPTIKTLMADTGMSRNGVLRAIREAIDEDFLVQIGGSYSGASNRYQIPSSLMREKAKVVNNPSQVGTPDKKAKSSTRPKLGPHPSQVETPPVPSWDPKRNLEEDLRSESVGMCDERGSKLRLVVDKSHQDYSTLLRTPGWKPSDGYDRKAAEDLCFELGSTREDASEFGRYNSIRNWASINETSTVSDIAHAWVEHFKLTNRAAYEYEQSRRQSAERVMS